MFLYLFLNTIYNYFTRAHNAEDARSVRTRGISRRLGVQVSSTGKIKTMKSVIGKFSIKSTSALIVSPDFSYKILTFHNGIVSREV